MRPVVIDGSNVALAHGILQRQQRSLGRRSTSGQLNKDLVVDFSVRGIDLVADYFLKRGHRTVFAVLPQWRRGVGQTDDPALLDRLERKGLVQYSPSRNLGPGGPNYISYDDR